MYVERHRRIRPEFAQLSPAEQLDPDRLYRTYFDREAKSAEELVPFLVYNFIPYSLIKSFALAIDPFKKFRVSTTKITPINRTRERRMLSVIDKMSFTYHKRTKTEGVNYSFSCVPRPSSDSSSTDTTTNRSAGPTYPVITKDTTMRTRPIGSTQGEFEHRTYKAYSPSRTVRLQEDSLIQLPDPPCGFQYTKYRNYEWASENGASATLDYSDLSTLFDNELAELNGIMQKKALSVLPKIVPGGRRYSMYRNIIELKDLTRGILSLKAATFELEKLLTLYPTKFKDILLSLKDVGKTIPKEYVSFNFGWRQTYRDIVALLVEPARITKEINNLILRSGKPTTYRIKQEFALDGRTSPGFSYYNLPLENTIVDGTSVTRRCELRGVVNATFDFPLVGRPEFAENLFYEKLGVIPTPIDLYNLVPWTWLVDWFTGLGNYLEAIQTVNSDDSLYNWGFITGILSGDITTTRKSETLSSSTSQIVPNPGNTVTTKNVFTSTSVGSYKLICRKAMGANYGVTTIAEGNLNPYQQSILGAILLTRSGSRGPHK